MNKKICQDDLEIHGQKQVFQKKSYSDSSNYILVFNATVNYLLPIASGSACKNYIISMTNTKTNRAQLT